MQKTKSMSRGIFHTVRVEIWAPDDKTPTIQMQKKRVKIQTDGKVLINSLGQWVPGKIVDGQVVLVVRLSNKTIRISS